jgi:DNA-binding NtrC family response regulator
LAIKKSEALPFSYAMVKSVYVKPMRPIPLLYVEDEPVLRKAAERFLSRFGYQVLAVEGVEEAKRALAERHFEVVLSDVVLLDGTGPDLHAWVRENLPSMERKFVFCSGWMGPEQQQYIVATGLPLLNKPFDWGHAVLTLQRVAPPRNAESEPPPSRSPSSENGNPSRGSSRHPAGSESTRSYSTP